MANLVREAMPGLQAALLANLADSVTYEAMGFEPFTLAAILLLEPAGSNQLPIAGTAEFRLSDLPAAPKERDEMTYGGVVYGVYQPAVDSDGWCRVSLRKLRTV